MSKNFAAIYSGGNDSSALNQSFFIQQETVRGFIPSVIGNNSFMYTLGGGSVNFQKPYELSQHKTGRHANNIIEQKSSTDWSLSTLFNIAQDSLVTYDNMIDSPIKTLWLAVLGAGFISAPAKTLKYDASSDPSVTFTILENLDMMAKQAVGSFVQQVEVSLAGDGVSQMNWSGNSKYTYHAGIGRSVVDNDANTVTLGAGEGLRFDVGSIVMLIENDGVTRSADTPAGTFRTVTAVTGDVVTLSGAVLTDADGSVTPVYLCYYEPAEPVGIDEPQTGLKGKITIDNLPTLTCVRSATLTINNNHELNDYCYGTDGLSGSLFVPSSRLEANLSIELNLNQPLVEFMKRVRNFEANDITMIVGDSETVGARIFKTITPRVIFNVPSITVPDSGSIPVSFDGACLQSALNAADEVQIYFQEVL
jgi:hypothetical protein